MIDCELSNLQVRSHAELASRPTPSHLFHFSLHPLAITSLTPTLPFLSFTLSVPLAAHNPPHIHPHLLNQISISIQLWVFLLNQREQEQPTSLPGYCTAHVRRSSLLLGSCYISTLTDSIPLSVCLFSIYSPLVIVAPFLTSNGRYVLSDVPYFSFGDEVGRFGVLS